MMRQFAVLAAVLAAAGCGARPSQRAYEYMPDMAHAPTYKAYAPNPVTRDGATLQKPVAGTAPRGYEPFRYGTGEAEAERAGRELRNPHEIPDERELRNGGDLFKIYCMICHGEKGTGDGPLAGKIAAPPSYTSDRVMAFPPGRIFHVVTMGSGRMRSYASQLSAAERWQIVSYVRIVLQHRGGKGQ